MPGHPASKIRRVMLEQTWLAQASRQDHLVHHLGGTLPLRRTRTSQRQVVTIHDLQPLEFPENFSWTKRKWLGRMIPSSVRAADAVMCPSRFTADRIGDLLGVEAAKIRVVAQGHLPQAEPARRPTSPQLESLLGDRPFLLYPAIAYGHKRHADLVETMNGLPQELDDLQLVLTGRPGPETPGLKAQVAARGLGDRVHFLGRVPAVDLEWLYTKALALAFPSSYEGFGNPCIEAMSLGCPVIASNAAALPEVVGDGGLLVTSGDIEAWVGAIVRLWGEPELAAELRVKGHRRVDFFSPGMASKRLLGVYRDVLGIRPTAAR